MTAPAAPTRIRRFTSGIFRKIAWSEAAWSLGAYLLWCHYQLVAATNRVVRSPASAFYDPFDAEPVIIALWHGEHFLMPYFGWRRDKMNILVTAHRDGEIMVRGGERCGLKFIRGSGDHGKEFARKKAVQAFTTMLRLLRDGETIVMTADMPKIARVAGLGIVTLAKHSGCPIVPVALATSRHYRLANWDRTCVNLPFGRMAMVRGESIRVARDADDAALETARQLVEQELNAVTTQAYALAKG